jgi:hypothetical protein
LQVIAAALISEEIDQFLRRRTRECLPGGPPRKGKGATESQSNRITRYRRNGSRLRRTLLGARRRTTGDTEQTWLRYTAEWPVPAKVPS